jgi:predicted phosphodiesterase
VAYSLPSNMEEVLVAANDRILCISDMHMPYQHPETQAFLLGLKRKYDPTMVISVGDEVDYHAMSFHDSDPDLPSAGDELENAITELFPLYQIFPEVHLVDSNHGSMVYRKGKHNGIARKFLKDYRDILEAPKGWQWHDNLLVDLPRGQKLYVTHGVMKDGLKLAEKMGCCTVQGHYHTEFNIKYSSSPAQLIWSMQVGCSVDDRSMAFHYNKTTATRPIIGHGIIINGLPRLLPMLMKQGGEWTGLLP